VFWQNCIVLTKEGQLSPSNSSSILGSLRNVRWQTASTPATSDSIINSWPTLRLEMISLDKSSRWAASDEQTFHLRILTLSKLNYGHIESWNVLYSSSPSAFDFSFHLQVSRTQGPAVTFSSKSSIFTTDNWSLCEPRKQQFHIKQTAHQSGSFSRKLKVEQFKMNLLIQKSTDKTWNGVQFDELNPTMQMTNNYQVKHLITESALNGK
jgi:hypothetical protein